MWEMHFRWVNIASAHSKLTLTILLEISSSNPKYAPAKHVCKFLDAESGSWNASICTTAFGGWKSRPANRKLYICRFFTFVTPVWGPYAVSRQHTSRMPHLRKAKCGSPIHILQFQIQFCVFYKFSQNFDFAQNAATHLEMGTSNVRLNLKAHQQVGNWECKSAKLNRQIQNICSQIFLQIPQKHKIWGSFIA